MAVATKAAPSDAATKASKKTMAQRAGMSDAAVAARTGKNWPAWVKLIDAAGGRKMSHQQIVAWLSKEHGVGPWWQQMVTVGYEKIVGKREKHQTASGYSVTATATLPAALAQVYTAFLDPGRRRRWLGPVQMEVTTAHANQSLRIKWLTDDSRLDVRFTPRAPGKTQIAIEQSRLKNAAAGLKAKAWWKERLKALGELLGA